MLRASAVGVLIVGLLGAASAAGAPPALKVKQFPVPGGNVLALTAGPGGMWFSEAGGPTNLGRVTPAGAVKRWKVPGLISSDNSAAGNSIVYGPDRNIWITGLTSDAWVVARVRPNGVGKVIDLGMPNLSGRDAIAGLGTRKGGPLFYGIWWNKAGRVSTSGSVLPPVTNGFPQTAAALGWAADRAGAMWFVYGRGYGRITGTTTRTWEPAGRHNFVDVTLGADGLIYLADRNSPQKLGIARVGADGSYKQFRVAGGVGSIATGPDGNVWGVVEYTAELVRVTPKGVVKSFAIPGNTSQIASGFGKLWIVTGNAGFVGRVDLPPK